MSCLNRLKPGAMFLMVGLLPLAASQAQAQSTSAASLLGSSVIALPSDAMNTDSDSNNDLLGDINLGDADLLGTQSITTISHSGSGFSSGWLLGGLGAAAGVVGLASGGGSSAASLLRTPASPAGPTYATELGTTSTIAGNTVTISGGTTPTGGGVNAGNAGAGSGSTGSGGGVSGGSGSTGSGGGVIGGSSTVNSFNGPSGGGISSGNTGPLSITPEPGSMALLGGLSLMLTAVKLRRRKR